MSTEPNVAGIARLIYIVAGIGLAAWGLWGADPGWTRLAWLVLGGAILVLGLIGYSPLHAWFSKKNQKVS